MTGWAAGRTAAPRGGLGICAGRPGRRSVDRAGWSAIEQAGPIVCTEEAHAKTALVWGRDRSPRLPCTRQPRPARREEPVWANGYGWAVNLRDHGTGGYGAVARATSPDTPFGPGHFAWRRMRARRWGETRGRGAANGSRSARRPAAPAPCRWVGVDRVLRATAEPDSPVAIAQRRGVGFAQKGSSPGSRAQSPPRRRDGPGWEHGGGGGGAIR